MRRLLEGMAVELSRLAAAQERMEKALAELRAKRGEEDNPRALSIPRAAKRLGRSATTVRRLIRAGAILTVTIGKTRMVPISEIDGRTVPADRPARRTGRAKRDGYSAKDEAAKLRGR